MSKKAPVLHYEKMLYNGSFSPSTLHTRNNTMFCFFVEYLLQKAVSVFEFSGMPETWDKSYFIYHLFCDGWISVINTERYGVIPQRCTLTGINVYNLPNKVIVTNALLPEVRELTIGEDCCLLKLMPDYHNIMDIVNIYADMMACAMETAGVSMINSKLAYVFMTDNKNMAESFKKLYDKISAGEPMVVADKALNNADGTPSYDYFMQNIKQNYIATDVLNDLRTLENMFNTEVGIRNANTQKRERLISDEVNANNEETRAKVYLWLESLQDGVDKINQMFNLDLSVRYRYEGSEADDTGYNVNTGTI